jgi:plasmid replication initiation protein
MNTENENKKIVQHNNLINGRFDITNTELRIFIYMLTQINKDDTDFKVCQIPIKTIMPNQGGKSYKIIKSIADNLLKKTFKLETLSMRKNKEVRTFVGYTIFSKSRYVEGENQLEMMFNSEIKDYLLNLKGNFTSAEWIQLMNIKTVYSYRIYWFLKQYQTFGERTIKINELKEMLMLKDEKTGKYKYSDFNNFKVRVLETAQDELKNTDMAFSFDGIKEGKAFYAVQFKLDKKVVHNQLPVSLTTGAPAPMVVQPLAIKGQDSNLHQRALNILMNLQVDEKIAKSYLATIDPQTIISINYNVQLVHTQKQERRKNLMCELDKEMLRIQFATRKNKITDVLNS